MNDAGTNSRITNYTQIIKESKQNINIIKSKNWNKQLIHKIKIKHKQTYFIWSSAVTITPLITVRIGPVDNGMSRPPPKWTSGLNPHASPSQVLGSTVVEKRVEWWGGREGGSKSINLSLTLFPRSTYPCVCIYICVYVCVRLVCMCIYAHLCVCIVPVSATNGTHFNCTHRSPNTTPFLKSIPVNSMSWSKVRFEPNPYFVNIAICYI